MIKYLPQKKRNELRDYSLKNHGFSTVENKRDAKLLDSSALMLDLNDDICTSCLVQYRAKDDAEISLYQLKEFDCIEPFDYDAIDSDFPKDSMLKNGYASMNIDN